MDTIFFNGKALGTGDVAVVKELGRTLAKMGHKVMVRASRQDEVAGLPRINKVRALDIVDAVANTCYRCGGDVRACGCQKKVDDCPKCGGSGTYVWGAIVNGVPSKSGTCFDCAGKGYVTAADKLRDERYHNLNDRAF